ncbi:hypothetical protein D5086_017485 [Populus alba]|uniref:Uncharacterized protein n=1 Tax=Populus alba TaxID=43335 RepID=A0ACC4BM29_POPAL
MVGAGLNPSLPSLFGTIEALPSLSFQSGGCINHRSYCTRILREYDLLSYFFSEPFFPMTTTKNGQIKNFTLNFGPQHPAALIQMGVSRSVLEMNGEVVERISDENIITEYCISC